MKLSSSRSGLFSQIEAEKFDVIVVGGGITGSGICRDAVMRGLKVLLIEKGDFASGTSSKSGKLVHGGLRYLKYFKLGLVFESLRERFRLVNIVAPHLVKSVKWVFPFNRRNRTARWMVLAGLMVYDFLALFRNGSIRHGITREKLRELEPYLRGEGSLGAVTFLDCTCPDTRLTIDTLKSAVDEGATLVNYCEMKMLEFHSGIVHVIVMDHLEKKSLRLKARVVIAACGVWADDILERANVKKRFGMKLTSGIHLVFSRKRLPVNHIQTFEAIKDVRYLYVVPWMDHVLVGTTDRFYDGSKEWVPVLAEDAGYLIDSLNFYFPDADLSFKDVKSAFSGIRPLVGSECGKKEEAMSRDYSILVDPRGLVSISGGKLTTYRSMAEKIVNRVAQCFFQDRKLKPCQTLSPISGALPVKKSSEALAVEYNVSESLISRLISRYGSNCFEILEIVRGDREKVERVSEKVPYIRAEIDYFMKREFVQKLSDICVRRSNIFLLSGDSGVGAAGEIAEYMAVFFDWSEERVRFEVEGYRREVSFSLENLKG